MKVKINGAEVDLLTVGAGGALAASGSVAARLLNSGMRTNALRTLATLRKEEWIELDNAIIEAAKPRLTGVADLERLGLTFNMKNGLGSTVLEYEDLGEMTPAELNMDGVTRGRNDRVEYTLKYLPLPLAHKSFFINIRVLAASRMRGDPLDTTQAEQASRTVADLWEDMLFNGCNSFAFGGGIIYGYCDHPQRIGYVLAKPWTAATGTEILADVRAMKQASINRMQYGPWILYIPTEYETVLDDDFKAESDKPVRQRIKEISGISDIKVADHLTAGNVVLAQMRRETVRWVKGMKLTNVEWQTEGNMIFNHKVMGIGVPQIRADQNGNCGIVHGRYVDSET